jgi:LysR family glycine cleavage system transcriptional activator
LQVPLIQSTVSVVQWADWFALRFDRAHMALDAAAQSMEWH